MAKEEEPLSPMARMFQSSGTDYCTVIIVGFKTKINPDVILDDLKQNVSKHPRISSKLAEDGTRWIKTQVNVEDHVFVPDIDPDEIGDQGDKFVDDYISRLTMLPLDRSRPLWDIHILNVKTSDAEAIGVIRSHHSLGDGMSRMSLIMACTHKSSDPEALPTIPKCDDHHLTNAGLLQFAQRMAPLMPPNSLTWRCRSLQQQPPQQQQGPAIAWTHQCRGRGARVSAPFLGGQAWPRRVTVRVSEQPIDSVSSSRTSRLSSRLRKLMGLEPNDLAAAADAAARAQAPRAPQDWGISHWEQDWDNEEELAQEELDVIADEAEEDFRSNRGPYDTLRDKWITPLLDFQSVSGAVDLDQERTEENLAGEALANQDESQRSIRYALQLIGIPLITGFIVSRALADPVLSFTLQNNEDAFAMTDTQKIEGAHAVHIEEARMRMDAAIGKAPPLTEERLLEHLRDFAAELEEEERHHNEQTLITIVSDSVSSIMLFGMLLQKTRGRTALYNTMSRLFEGLSDIAKAVMIILIADTLLGYHSEEGWTGFIELVAGHYGVEAEEEAMVVFVGVVPVVIDVLFKYWIFVGLNKISPGAVVTIKQVDTH